MIGNVEPSADASLVAFDPPAVEEARATLALTDGSGEERLEYELTGAAEVEVVYTLDGDRLIDRIAFVHRAGQWLIDAVAFDRVAS